MNSKIRNILLSLICFSIITIILTSCIQSTSITTPITNIEPTISATGSNFPLTIIPNTTPAQIVTPTTVSEEISRVSFPKYLQNKITYISREKSDNPRKKYGRYQINAINNDGTAQEKILESEFDIIDNSCSPDRSKIAFRIWSPDREIFIVNADGIQKSFPTDDLWFGRMLSWSPDGSKLAYISFSSIFIIDGNTFNQVKIPVDGIYVGSRPSWSPDGTRIAYCVGPGLGDPMPEESTHIWVMNSDGTNRINLTANRRYSFNPSWSPDGTRITFSSNGELSIMNADGTDQIQLFDNSKGYIGHSMWSLDGHKIAFLRSQLSSEIIGLYIANIDGSDAVRVIENENVSAEFAWSGDSKKIAFTMKTDLYLQIFIANIDRTNQLRLTDNTQDSYGLCWVQ